MMAMRSLLLDQRGFSLAELLMVVAILGLMLAGLVFVRQQGQQSYLMGAHRVEAQQNARVALDPGELQRDVGANSTSGKAWVRPVRSPSLTSRFERRCGSESTAGI